MNEPGPQQGATSGTSADSGQRRGFGRFFGGGRKETTVEPPVVAPVVTPESTPHVVTKQEAEAINKQKEEKCSAFMDQIEASREQQGDWFIKFGKKEENGIDNRALVFIEPGVDSQGLKRLAAITKDGVMLAGTGDGAEDLVNFFKSIPTKPHNEDFVYKSTGGEAPHLTVNLGTTVLENFYLGIRMDENVAKDAMKKSRDAAEAPHKELAESAQKTIDTVGSLRNMVSQFPPK